MIPMLLVFGSLVPASDSPELTTTPPQPGAVGASVDVRDLIRRGMRTGEMKQILGKPTRESEFLRGNLKGPSLSHEYERLGIVVESDAGRVIGVTRVKPTK
jgi:hypothetical protein